MSGDQRAANLPAMLFAAILLSGCAAVDVPPDAPVGGVGPPSPLASPAERAPAETATATPRPSPSPAAPPPLPPVAIVLSNRAPAFERVAVEIAGRFPEQRTYDLDDRSQSPETSFRLINDSAAGAVVAIGLAAAKSAVTLAAAPVIFCQVFNYQEHDLVTGNSRGVAALPPLDLQLSAWKRLDPKIETVGAILGEGHEPLLAEAEAAAARHGVELHVRIVASDRETLYHFKRLVGDIDGFWLFPDNRVLSAPVLEQMFEIASRKGVRMAVFSETLLPLGAALSAESLPENIADVVVSLVRSFQQKAGGALSPITPLTDIRIVSNDEVLKPAATDSVARSGGGGKR